MQVRKLRVRKDVLIHKLADAGTDGAAVGVGWGNAMVHEQPTVAQQTPHDAEVRRQILLPDMFEHADTRDFVERRVAEPCRGIAVVEQQHLHAFLKSGWLNALVGEGELVVWEGNADGLHAIVLRRM